MENKGWGYMLYYKLYGWVLMCFLRISTICLWKESLTMFSSLDLLLFGVCCITFVRESAYFCIRFPKKTKLLGFKIAMRTWHNLH